MNHDPNKSLGLNDINLDTYDGILLFAAISILWADRGDITPEDAIKELQKHAIKCWPEHFGLPFDKSKLC